MEDTLVEVRSTAAKTIAERKEATRRLARLGEAQKGWEEKAEPALSKGREDLAKGALVEKGKRAETAALLQQELEELGHLQQLGEAQLGKLARKIARATAQQQAPARGPQA